MAETITPDLCIIGGGLAGLTAANEARALGASVVLVERGRLGGSDLNSGTLPSKALAAAAARAAAVRRAPGFGIATEEPRVNTRRVYEHVAQTVAAAAPRDSHARLEAMGVHVVIAAARFADARTVAAGDFLIRARRFVIATGARTVVPAIPGLDAVPYFTLETIFDNTRKLTHLVIVGGGPIGVELAQSYRRLGSAVTLVEPGTPLAGVDPEFAAVAIEQLQEEGVDIRIGSNLAEIQPRSQGIGVVVRGPDGEPDQLDVSHILIAEERVPDIGSLELDRAGIRPRKDDSRFIRVSNTLRTTNRRVYAIGDASGAEGYGPLAAWQARHVVASALLARPVRADARLAPRTVFTDPEIAEAGLNEPAARAGLGGNFAVLRASFADNDRARAMRATRGEVKLIVSPEGRVLGAGAVGDRAAELVAFLGYVTAEGGDVASLARYTAPHPTIAGIVTTLAAEHRRQQGGNPLLKRIASVVRLLP